MLTWLRVLPAVAVGAVALLADDIVATELIQDDAQPEARMLRRRPPIMSEFSATQAWRPWLLYPGGDEPLPWVARPDTESYSFSNNDKIPPNGMNKALISDATKEACFEADDESWFWNVSSPTILPFLVDQSSDNRIRRSNISFLVIPGGECSVLRWTKEGVDAAAWLNSLGISAFVLKYRVPCNVQHTYDAMRAMRMIQKYGKEFDLDTSKIAVIGFGSGAEAALMLSHRTNEGYRKRYDDMDDLGVRPLAQFLIYPKFTKKILSNVSAAPTTFLALTMDDRCHRASDAVNYYASLKEQRRPRSEMHIFGSGKGGFGVCSTQKQRSLAACAWKASARRFIEAELFGLGTMAHETHGA